MSENFSSSTTTKQAPTENQQLAVCSKGKEGREWYLGFASMMNKDSLASRGIIPTESFPVVVPGYSLGFAKHTGFATLRRRERKEQQQETTAEDSCAFSSRKGAAVAVGADDDDDDDDDEDPFEKSSGAPLTVHGVIHRCSPENFKVLDDVEANYLCVPIQCQKYSGSSSGNNLQHQQQEEQEQLQTTVEAWTYMMTDEMYRPPHMKGKPWKLPSERYLDILTRGGAAHGVDSEYLQKVKTLPHTPRKKVEEYDKFTIEEVNRELGRRNTGRSTTETSDHGVEGKLLTTTTTTATMTREELNTFLELELDREKYCCSIINSKIILETIATRGQTFLPLGYGLDQTVLIAQIFYEPEYKRIVGQATTKTVGGEDNSKDDDSHHPSQEELLLLASMSENHKAWCEDHIYNYYKDKGFEVQCIGMLVDH